VLLALLCVCILSYANAQTHARVPISRELVAEAVRSAGTEIAPEQVQLLSNVTVRAGATLRVAKVVAAPSGKLLAKVACKDPRECLPFYVLIDASKDGLRGANNPQLKNLLGKPKERPLVARGQPVTLIIDRTDSRITLSVICLEGGMPGQTIRVASPDRRRIYTAEVVNGTLVRSAL
jgi:hypothetical protein